MAEVATRKVPLGRGWAGVKRPKLRALNIAITLVLAVFWWNLYRPSILGGPAEYAVVDGVSMESTLHDGDLVVTRRHETYHVGEIIAYVVPDGDPNAGLRVVHRIVGGSAADGYVTQGDNRNEIDPWRPRADDVMGSVALRVPYAGSVIEVLREPPVFAWFVGSILLVGIWSLSRHRRSDTRL
jgi:signal peptidase